MKITFTIYPYNRFENRYLHVIPKKNYKSTQLYTLNPVAKVAKLPACGQFHNNQSSTKASKTRVQAIFSWCERLPFVTKFEF